jgi:hypothetical protein
MTASGFRSPVLQDHLLSITETFALKVGIREVVLAALDGAVPAGKVSAA